MPKWRVPQIMREARRFHHIGVKTAHSFKYRWVGVLVQQTLRQASPNLGDFQAVRQPIVSWMTSRGRNNLRNST
jgi:hypothetical protein